MMDAQPFSGFPQAGLDFLAQLAVHNERTWFEAHKDEYQKFVLEPAQAFILTLGAKLRDLSSALQVDPRTDGRGVMMRIHRDTRFSKDKTPYKANVSGLFWEGTRRKMECSAFGFQIEAGGVGLMAGIFKFPPDMLTMYREAVIGKQQGTELAEIVENLRREGIYQVNGEHYKRVPAGLDPNHPRADLLRYDGLYVYSPSIPAADILTPALVDICYAHYQKMAPIQRWLATM